MPRIIQQYGGQFLLTGPALPGERLGDVIRDQAQYDALVGQLPEFRIQMKQPAPKNADPLLARPAIDFAMHMLVFTVRRSAFYGPTISSVAPDGGGGLRVEVVHKRPAAVMAVASRDDVGTYAAVLIPRHDGPVVFHLREDGS